MTTAPPAFADPLAAARVALAVVEALDVHRRASVGGALALRPWEVTGLAEDLAQLRAAVALAEQSAEGSEVRQEALRTAYRVAIGIDHHLIEADSLKSLFVALASAIATGATPFRNDWGRPGLDLPRVDPIADRAPRQDGAVARAGEVLALARLAYRWARGHRLPPDALARLGDAGTGLRGALAAVLADGEGEARANLRGRVREVARVLRQRAGRATVAELLDAAGWR